MPTILDGHEETSKENTKRLERRNPFNRNPLAETMATKSRTGRHAAVQESTRTGICICNIYIPDDKLLNAHYKRGSRWVITAYLNLQPVIFFLHVETKKYHR